MAVGKLYRSPYRWTLADSTDSQIHSLRKPGKLLCKRHISPGLVLSCAWRNGCEESGAGTRCDSRNHFVCGEQSAAEDSEGARSVEVLCSDGVIVELDQGSQNETSVFKTLHITTLVFERMTRQGRGGQCCMMIKGGCTLTTE